jgi:drug/metabolite transporter (DMT)-like permease
VDAKAGDAGEERQGEIMRINPLAAVALSAALFGVSTPLAKLLLGGIHPVALAGLLYAGVFVGLGACRLAGRLMRRGGCAAEGVREAPLERRDLPWLAGAILAGGIVAPICLMTGLHRTTGFAASLLLNFEAAATALVAVVLFKESAGRRVWTALALMTAGGVLLSWDPGQGKLELPGRCSSWRPWPGGASTTT